MKLAQSLNLTLESNIDNSFATKTFSFGQIQHCIKVERENQRRNVKCQDFPQNYMYIYPIAANTCIQLYRIQNTCIHTLPIVVIFG